MLKASWGVMGSEYSEQKANFWFNALKDYELSDILEAFMTASKDTDKFARRNLIPGDIIRNIEGSQKDMATKAFRDVMKAIRFFGSYDKPEFDEETEEAIEALGGWKRICMMKESESGKYLEDFCRYYVPTYGKKKSARKGANFALKHEAVSRIAGKI